MKAQFDSFMQNWKVKGLGTFSTLEKAQEAIKKHKGDGQSKKSGYVSVCLTEDIKSRLQEMAKTEKLTLSAMARKLIEEGVSDYGKKG